VTVRLALVGAGRIGSFHADALDGSDVARFTVVIEPTGRRPAALAAGIPVVTEVSELRDHAVDAALVAVPSRLHVQVIGQLLAFGVPILSEKPCGLTPGETASIAAAADAAGVPVRVAYWRRFAPELVRARDDVLAGRLGDISLIASHQWDEEPPPAAFRDPLSCGGIVVDCGVHDLDTVQWVTGQRVRSIVGYASSVTSVTPVPGDPESASLVAALDGGSTAVITLGRRQPEGERQTVEVIGTRGVRRITLVDRSDLRLLTSCFRALVEDFARTGGGPDGRTATVQEAAQLLRLATSATEQLGRGMLDE
jgi:myo-inositol 2-dehydrogenase / D-chiro-inositol 1-dehydrogenase